MVLEMQLPTADTYDLGDISGDCAICYAYQLPMCAWEYLVDIVSMFRMSSAIRCNMIVVAGVWIYWIVFGCISEYMNITVDIWSSLTLIGCSRQFVPPLCSAGARLNPRILTFQKLI